jgi:hypothetical protein
MEILMPDKIITVQIRRGLITEVSGLPKGYLLRVEDYDVQDTDHSSWDPEKECVISIIENTDIFV